MAATEISPPETLKLDSNESTVEVGASKGLEAAEATVVSVESVEMENGPEEGAEVVPERWIQLAFTWSGKPFTLDIAESDRVFDLKASLQSLTDVPPERQKILGLVKGKLPPEEQRIGDLKLTNGKKFTLVGTPQGHEIKDPSQIGFLPDILNDLDIDFAASAEATAAYRNDQRNLRKIREATKKLQIDIITPLRPGKRLLVLDIDYTIIDSEPLTSGALPPMECIRPGLHEFLELIYPYYDICIWSQTHWRWLETKLVEIGMLGNPERNYRITLVLDYTSMFTVFSTRNGKPYSHHVKALQIIWNHFPQYNAKNTIHVDDLGRNFVLNPGQGLKISAFKGAHTQHAQADRELSKLANYMLLIANMDDFRRLDHRDWKKFLGGTGGGRSAG
ncbi:hypothetical protein JAAARDRAFT_32118 [Jaapia argillacea MUCL 33604]|uniref:protein-serine/threonine phosphatase n=1 Tax=Jaapia argillacea MUCL 33604 TaxID=933084 RepID=A0A067Q4L7_9AGAM|nr:hypothetical protein JAAARDRAFT_32118 [Jaapia argillacea MUCL 33604]